MNPQELDDKVRNFETLAGRSDEMSGAERQALYAEVYDLHTSLLPSTMMKKYGAGGAVAGAVLPVLGLFSGGAVGAIVGAVRANRDDVIEARRRLERLLDRLT